MDQMVDISFYKGKKVFVTGHTGFKGSWLSSILLHAGADVFGYALEPPTQPSLFKDLKLEEEMTSMIADVRDLEQLQKAVLTFAPDIVIHMAAQPLVRLSYDDPVMTYETNVMGTVNILEAVRHCKSVKSFVNVTTDKVYLNHEWCYGYREHDELNGYDPYSNSKSCSELVTSSYFHSFFENGMTAISTARAGNVIGGGDYALDRIIPDCIRAAESGKKIIVRNPNSIRPYQHVLEPLFGYLYIAQKQFEDKTLEGAYNVGPADDDYLTTGELTDVFCAAYGEGCEWENVSDGGPHEATFLKLDLSKIKSKLRWKPVWDISTAVQKTVEWHKAAAIGQAVEITNKQIEQYIEDGASI